VESSAITVEESLLCALMHTFNYTRPDIGFRASYLAWFVNAVPTDKYARMVGIIQYPKGTASYGLYLEGPSVDCPLYVFCDADCKSSQSQTSHCSHIARKRHFNSQG
jgi:hypothetical protein